MSYGGFGFYNNNYDKFKMNCNSDNSRNDNSRNDNSRNEDKEKIIKLENKVKYLQNKVKILEKMTLFLWKNEIMKLLRNYFPKDIAKKILTYI